MVNLQGDEAKAYEGVLWSSRGQWLTLRQVTVHRAGSPSAAMDGEMVVHRSRIDFLQVLPN